MRRDSLLPEWLVSIMLFVQRHGGRRFGHLPFIKPALLALEDWFNGRGRPKSKLRKFFARIIHWNFGLTPFYLDLENGNDVNDGSDWANAWKTITSGPTAARIAPGDVIRIAKTPDPVSLGNVTFTDNDSGLTLASAATLNIDTCEAAWTPSASVTANTNTTYYKEGAKSISLAIAAAFVTGKIAYLNTATLNLSGYEKVSLWIRPSIDIAANTLRLDLCSDDAGDTPVNSFTITHRLEQNQWHAITFDNAAALGNAIESIALTALLDPGTVTLYIDNILACNDLTLNSVIGKSDADGWWPIRSINGTAVVLAAIDHYGSSSNVVEYQGDSETVTGYVRNGYKTDIPTNSTDAVSELQDSGSLGSLIEFSGGWNTGTTERDGYTFLDGFCGWGYGLKTDGKSYVKLSYLGFISYYYGINIRSASGLETDHVFSIGNQQAGVAMSWGCYRHTYNYLSVIGNSSGGYDGSGGGSNPYDFTFNNCNAYGNDSYGFYDGQDVTNFTFNDCKAKGNSSGFAFYIALGAKLTNCQTKNNSSAGIQAIYGGFVDCNNCLIEDSTELTVGGYDDSYISSKKHDQTANNHVIQCPQGKIQSETSVRHTESGLSWKMTPSSATMKLKIHPHKFKAAVDANSEVTITVYVRKNDTYNGNAPRLVLVGGILTGIATDVVDTLSVGADEWEQLTVSGTPTEAGVLEFYVDCDGTAGSIYVDDFSVSQ